MDARPSTKSSDCQSGGNRKRRPATPRAPPQQQMYQIDAAPPAMLSSFSSDPREASMAISKGQNDAEILI
jgi:hypothetical protein